MPVMQRQELPPRLRKVDFSAISFVPNVPHDPIGILLERKLSCGIDGQLAVSGGLFALPKINPLRGLRIHGPDSLATRPFFFHRGVCPLPTLPPSDVQPLPLADDP